MHITVGKVMLYINDASNTKKPQYKTVSLTEAESLTTNLLLVKTNAACVKLMTPWVQLSSSLQTLVLDSST